jgi:hypothetical protein
VSLGTIYSNNYNFVYTKIHLNPNDEVMEHHLVHNLSQIQFNRIIKLSIIGKGPNWLGLWRVTVQEEHVYSGMFAYNLHLLEGRIQPGEPPWQILGKSNDGRRRNNLVTVTNSSRFCQKHLAYHISQWRLIITIPLVKVYRVMRYTTYLKLSLIRWWTTKLWLLECQPSFLFSLALAT